MTIWQEIFKKLKEFNIDVYPPATKHGECTTKYVVVKQDGKAQADIYSSEHSYYQFILYVPQNQYDQLSSYEAEVKKVLDTNLYPLLKPTGSSMPDYYDDTLKAHTRSFLYRNNVRNVHL